jgi:twitching motility protein PilT
VAQQSLRLDINEMLEEVIKRGASDLHITVGVPPVLRINGVLQRMDLPKLTSNDTREMVYSILTARQREALESNLEFDLSYSVPGSARFRVNAYFQRNSVGAAFRIIPYRIKTIEELMLPMVVKEFARLPRGFILVTGPTGQGKSTSLAAIMDLINSTREEHIITVEDPIEFLHLHKKCIVNQREVGSDTHSFANALKYAMRQDPDVILVGEMRDLETIQTALTAAETGHLVFATLHTQDAPQSIDRIIDVFPTFQQSQVRLQLASTIQAAGRDKGQAHPRARGRDNDRDIRYPKHDPGLARPPDLLSHAVGWAAPHADHGCVASRPVPRRADNIRDGARQGAQQGRLQAAGRKITFC